MSRRFFSDRDVDTFNTINKSLMGKVVGTTCIVYKISSEETQTNVYGESTGMGKIYNPGVELDSLIDATDFVHKVTQKHYEITNEYADEYKRITT